MKIAVLGAGLVGGPMSLDLAHEPSFEINVYDRDARALEKLNKANPEIRVQQQDLSQSDTVTGLVKNCDLVVNAVPGFMGYQTLKAIIEAQVNVVDIAFFPEDPFTLDQLAKEKGVTAVVDCGVAPGMSNLLVGHVDRLLDRTDKVLIYVGGLPELREWPYEFKAGFSPIDVIEEYTRPARYVENGCLVVRPALSDAELLPFPALGTLEAFNSDGLRSLAQTIEAPNMKEKTLRYQGHIQKMAVLRETGFFSEEPVEVNGQMIRPIDFTAKLLFPMWQMQEGDRDITVMQVLVEGEQGGQAVRYTYDLLDRYDPETRTHSMARTTGYTATVVLRMLAQGLYSDKGISPPEFIGRHGECVDFVLEGLEKRGIRYQETVEKI